jgi:hypothetical protein
MNDFIKLSSKIQTSKGLYDLIQFTFGDETYTNCQSLVNLLGENIPHFIEELDTSPFSLNSIDIDLPEHPIEYIEKEVSNISSSCSIDYGKNLWLNIVQLKEVVEKEKTLENEFLVKAILKDYNIGGERLLTLSNEYIEKSISIMELIQILIENEKVTKRLLIQLDAQEKKKSILIDQLLRLVN